MSLARRKGVVVKIITPGIPDKKNVYSVTRSYYYSLIKGGIEFYEYQPGFLHAKNWYL
ncbi:MAG: phospholipase D-like domain-containing protein [Thomasclavelia ramosa]